MHKRAAGVLLLLLAAACTNDAVDPVRDLAPDGVVGKADGSCPSIPAFMSASAPPRSSCGPVDAQTYNLFYDINQFWGSGVNACACGPDFPRDCYGAYSMFGTGYIWVGTRFAQELVASSNGSLMPYQYALSHEMAHEVQGNYVPNVLAATEQRRELQADCLAGYYLGSVACRGLATENDIVTTLRTACTIADGTGDPIADQASHGTCEQRATAVARGMDGYLANGHPLDVCPL
jgi:hypothetical protein